MAYLKFHSLREESGLQLKLSWYLCDPKSKYGETLMIFFYLIEVDKFDYAAELEGL
jgi:hypothetical protein